MKKSLRKIPLLNTSAMSVLLTTCALSQGAEVIVSTSGNCSPVAVDTKGNVVFNINCQTYEAKPIQNRFRAIDDVLNRTENSSPMFFRPGGPSWTDFDSETHPFSNELADKISNSLVKERFYVVEGALAAWRQQFVRFLGWRLRREGNVVLLSDVREWQSTDKIEFNWEIIDQPQTIMMVDEAQFDPDQVRDFFYQVQRKTKNLKLIISYDLSMKFINTNKLVGGEVIEYLPKTVLSSKTISDQLVTKYADKIFHRTVGPRTLASFAKVGGSSHRGFHYGEDSSTQNEPNLWLVAAALQGWDGRTLPDGDSVAVGQNQGVEGITQQILASNVELGSLITVVAFFSRYNVAIPREFFIARLKYTQEVLAEGLKNGLLKVASGGIILNLRGMSELVLRSASNNGELILDVQRRVKGGPVATSLAEAAVSFGIYDYGALLLNINGSQDKTWAIDPIILSNYVIELASRDDSPGRIGRALLGLSHDKSDIAGDGILTSTSLDVTSFAKRLVGQLRPRIVPLLTSDGPSKETAWLLTGLQAVDRELAQRVVKSLPKPYLTKKASDERNAGRLGSFLWSLDNADHGVASDIVHSLGIKPLVSVITAANDPAGIGWLLEVLATTAPDVASSVTRSVSGNSFGHAWTKATRTSDLTALILGLTSADRAVAKQALAELTATDASDRVSEEQHSRVIGEFLIAISRLDPRLARAATEKVGASVLITNAGREVDPKSKAILLAGIAAANNEKGKALIASEVESGRLKEAEYERKVQMFSTQCPWCMAMAARDQEKQENENEAIQYYLEQYGKHRAVAGSDLNIADILAMHNYEPDRVREMARHGIFSRLIEQFQNLNVTEKRSFQEIYFSVDPTGFRQWMKSLATAPDPSPSLVQDWILIDTNGAADTVREMRWDDVVRIVANSLKLNLENIPALVAKADPDRFLAWLNEIDVKTSPIPKPLVELAKAGRLNPTTASWIRITPKMDGSSAASFFRFLSSDDIDLVRAIYSTDKKVFLPLTAAASSSNKMDIGVETLIDQPDRLDFVSELLGRKAGIIAIGANTLDNITKSAQLFSEALPCGYGDLGPITGSRAETLQSFFLRAKLFYSFKKEMLDSFLIERCFQTLTTASVQLGAMFVKSVGTKRIMHLMDRLPGAAPTIASNLFRVSSSSFAAIRSRTSLTGNIGLKKKQERLEDILRMDPELANQLLTNTSDQDVLEIIKSSSFDEALKDLSALREINSSLCGRLLKALQDKDTLRTMISRGSALPNVEDENNDRDIRSALIKSALEKVHDEFFKQRLKAADYWPTEFLIEIVKAKPDEFLALMDQSVIEHFYEFQAFSGLVYHSEAAEFLKRLRQTDFQSWQAIMGRLDVRAVANSVQLSRAEAIKRKDVDMTDVYLPSFLEELALYDLGRLDILAEMIGLSSEALNDLKKDFAKPRI